LREGHPADRFLPQQQKSTEMPALAEPIITLALGNLQKLTENSEISTIWNVFTKCKDNLENGHRLENLTWRLWYRSCHSQKQDSIQSLEGYSKTFQETSILNQRAKMQCGSLPNTLPNSPKKPVPDTPVKKNVSSASHTKPTKKVDPQPSKEIRQPQAVKQQVHFAPPSKSVPVIANIQPPVTVKSSPQKPDLGTTSVQPSIEKPAVAKPKFFISRENSSDLSESEYTESGSEFDSDYDSENESIGSDESYEYPPPNLFKKSELHPMKRPSLLSVAIQRNQYRNKQLSPQCFEMGAESQLQADLSCSIKQGLTWDHAKPFTLGQSNMYDKYDVDTFDIW
jgi:hypothetical protein